MQKQLANALSLVFHPMLMVPFFALYNSLMTLEGTIVYVTVGVTLLATLFLAFYILRLKRNGKISNLDASDQTERQHRVYLPIIAVLSVTLAVFYILSQPAPVLWASFFFLLLFVVGYCLNFYIKASLHLAILSYFAFSFWHSNPILCFILLACCPFLAWSRLYLLRHSRSEIIIGFGLGAVIGLGQVFVIFSV